MTKEFSFDFSKSVSIYDSVKSKLKEKLTEDLATSHMNISSCHPGVLIVNVNSDVTGIFFNGTVQCPCKKYLIQFNGNVNSSTINYSNFY